MVAKRQCAFCAGEIEPGRGVMFVKRDGTVFYFCSGTCRKHQLSYHRVGHQWKWTRAHALKKEQARGAHAAAAAGKPGAKPSTPAAKPKPAAAPSKPAAAATPKAAATAPSKPAPAATTAPAPAKTAAASNAKPAAPTNKPAPAAKKAAPAETTTENKSGA